MFHASLISLMRAICPNISSPLTWYLTTKLHENYFCTSILELACICFSCKNQQHQHAAVNNPITTEALLWSIKNNSSKEAADLVTSYYPKVGLSILHGSTVLRRNLKNNPHVLKRVLRNNAWHIIVSVLQIFHI